MRHAANTKVGRKRNKALSVCGLLLLAVVVAVVTVALPTNHREQSLDLSYEPAQLSWEIPLVGSSKKKQTKTFTVPTPQARCEWVVGAFVDRDREIETTDEETLAKYQAQSEDVNVFYRATAHIFWKDYAEEGWGEGLHLLIEDEENILNNHGIAGTIEQERGELNTKSTWTWTTGDQHLSNFGAWRNRHNDVVFGVNDFDEGAIYDFGVDILRIAVSICNHAYTNGLSPEEIHDVLGVFTKSYIETVESYVGNEDADLFELTPKTTYGKLKTFLEKVEKKGSTDKQMDKFTTVSDNGERKFIKGGIDAAHANTSLATVPPEIESDIRAAFTSTRYGATMMKLGWAVPQWDDELFSVLDVAQRVGSGIGSFGVDRYYVLLKGTDGLLEDDEEGGAVILDVKYEPESAVHNILSDNDIAWYHVIFPNEAARVVEAQRKLTSYADPFLGWIELPDREANDTKPFYIRQRSPWKKGPDLAKMLRKAKDFEDFVAQIAASTATSHVRGSVGRAPGDFKRNIKTLLGGKKGRPWRKAVRNLAIAYREQVLLDFECFHDYVMTNLTSRF